MSTRKISVDTNCVAGHYAGPDEKIIEFSSPVGGGLISFVIIPDDQLSVHVYRHDMTVQVTAGETGEPVRHGNMRADAALYQAAKAFVADYESRFISRTGETPASYQAKHMYDPPQDGS